MGVNVLGNVLWTFLQLACVSVVVKTEDISNYSVGTGISDITGPAAEIVLMGYANSKQTGAGIHTRLFARSFIVGSITNENNRIVFVSADIGMGSQAVKTRVIKELSERGYGDLYTAENVLISGTHTHSSPGGFFNYLLLNISTWGFIQQCFDAIVAGIVQSILNAHDNVQPANIFINKGIVEGASINRSPAAYDNNPKEEKQLYDSNVDKEMTLLKFVSLNGEDLGSVNWFAVHATSMNKTNQLISGDNKGYASMLFEYKMNPTERPGKGKFVAAFASSNLGDVSPNTRGAKCIDTGKPCDYKMSTCNGSNEMCIAFGPGKDGNMLESTEIIGRKQFEVAQKLYQTANEKLSGPVQFNHQFVNMSYVEIKSINYSTGETETRKTCVAALGYSFAGGTTDGPGRKDFYQGETSGNLFWDAVRDFIHKPSPEQKECHRPKSILIDLGNNHFPSEWGASIVETQVFRIGDLFIIAFPGELTTMAGRRLRNKIRAMAQDNGIENPHMVIAGLSNVYSHYVTTIEEYQVQRYEGGSTLYGPHTLDAYLQQYLTLANTMLTGETIKNNLAAPDLEKKQISLTTAVYIDTKPLWTSFGDVVEEPKNLVTLGETVTTRFIGGNPRNDVQREGSFLLVEKLQEDSEDKWDVVATDADWSTMFHWKRLYPYSTQNNITITWNTKATLYNPEITTGFYRIRHFGYYKPPLQSPRPYNGTTRIFQIVDKFNAHLKSNSLWSENPLPKRKIRSPSSFWREIDEVNIHKGLLTGNLTLNEVAGKSFKNYDDV